MTSIHRVASGRAALAAEIVGSGDPVVFLHANIGDRRMWRAQLDSIGATHKAIAYDRRGFGETRADAEEHSAITDLMAVMGALADATPAILVGCSQGGRIAVDAALRHPSQIRGLILIAPTITGAPDAVYPPAIKGEMAKLKDAEQARDVERVIALKARLFLDGALGQEGRVAGEARRLFHDMNSIVLQAPPIGADIDAPPAFQRLGEIAVPTLVIWGSFDFPHIQARCRQVTPMMAHASAHELTGTAHLPSLDRPADVTALLTAFIQRCAGRG